VTKSETSQRVIIQLYHTGKTWYPLYRKLDGSQGRSGEVNLAPTRFDARPVHPVASRYTNCAIPAHFFKVTVTSNIPKMLVAGSSETAVIWLHGVTWQNTAHDVIRTEVLLLAEFFGDRPWTTLRAAPRRLISIRRGQAVRYRFLGIARSRTELVSLFLENIPVRPSNNTDIF